MLKAPALVEPAHELRRHLDSGALLTPWAEERCGQRVSADVDRINPPLLYRDEAGLLEAGEDSNWAALRRSGRLVQADGTEVARVTSVVLLAAASPELCRVLQTTDTPLGTALGDRGHSKVLWCSVSICEYAVACARVILDGDVPVALTTDWVLWSWLGKISAG